MGIKKQQSRRNSKKNSRRNRRGKKQIGSGNKPKSAFSKYLDNLSKSLDVKKGGAYSIDVENMIAGRATVKGYEDCSPPVVVGSKLVNKHCGTGCNLTGGKRKSKKKSRNHNKKRKNNKTKNKKGGHRVKKSKRKSIRSVQNIRKHKKRTQSAGGRLAPNKYPFKGEDNVMTPDMKNREFGCRQPKWNPKCV